MDRIWPTEGCNLLTPSVMILTCSFLIRIHSARTGRLVSLAVEVYDFRGSEMIVLNPSPLSTNLSLLIITSSSANIWLSIEMQIPRTSNLFKLTNILYIPE